MAKLRKHKCFRLIIVTISLVMMGCADSAERVTLQIGGEVFRVEIARSEEQMAQGLMFRESLPLRGGMLFVYPKDRHLSFWMKNTSVPLSIAFLTKDGIISQIEPMKPYSLKTINSYRAVRYALELRQGSFLKLGVQAGDRVVFPEGFR